MPQPSSLFYAVEALDICNGELEERLALILVSVEREREVHAAAMFFEELGALGQPPGHRAKPPALLIERHFQMAVLDRFRSVDDLHWARMEDRPGIREA